MTVDIASLRATYRLARLGKDDVADDPIIQFRSWFDEALASAVPEPNACTLATSSREGSVSARMILLKGVDDRGFAFFTNLESRKSDELRSNPRAALVFWWGPLERQVRVAGTVLPVSTAEADAYFGSRPRDSQLGAWASPQSQPVGSRQELDERLRQAEARFQDRPVDRPETWGGFLLRPTEIEFWQGRESRLHDRILYTRVDGQDAWTIERLAP